MAWMYSCIDCNMLDTTCARKFSMKSQNGCFIRQSGCFLQAEWHFFLFSFLGSHDLALGAAKTQSPCILLMYCGQEALNPMWTCGDKAEPRFALLFACRTTDLFSWQWFLPMNPSTHYVESRFILFDQLLHQYAKGSAAHFELEQWNSSRLAKVCEQIPNVGGKPNINLLLQSFCFWLYLKVRCVRFRSISW